MAMAPPLSSSLFPSKPLSSTFSSSLAPISLTINPPSKSLRFLTPSSTKLSVVSAAIAVGDKLPEATFSYLDSAGDVQTTTVSDLTKGKKAILFAVPGAFTPISSRKYLRRFVERSGELKSKGVDSIACISVDDAFVMKAWKDSLKVDDEVILLSDGNGSFTKAIGVSSKRYALLAEDGVVKVFLSFFGGPKDLLKAL